MTPRWMRIAFPIFGLIWLTLGVLSLAKGETGIGVVQLMIGTGWLLVTALMSFGRLN